MRYASAAAVSTAPDPTGRQIVEFTTSAPTDFPARVQALGGAVVWSSSRSGFATVSGLDATAVASLGRGAGVTSVTEDIAISLEARAVRVWLLGL